MGISWIGKDTNPKGGSGSGKTDDKKDSDKKDDKKSK